MSNMFLLIVCLFAVSETTLSKEGIRGSRLEVTLEYTRLKSYEVSSRTDEQEFLEKYEKPEEDSEGKVNTEYDIGRNEQTTLVYCTSFRCHHEGASPIGFTEFRISLITPRVPGS